MDIKTKGVGIAQPTKLFNSDAQKRANMAMISCGKIKALADLIDYEYWIILKDFKGFKDIQNRSRLILTNAKAIDATLKFAGAKPENHNAELGFREYTEELWTVMDRIMQLSKKGLSQLAADLDETDLLDKYDKITGDE